MAEEYERWLDELIEAQKKLLSLKYRNINGIDYTLCESCLSEIHIYDHFDEMASALHKVVTIEFLENINRYEKSFMYKGRKVLTLSKEVEDGNIQD